MAYAQKHGINITALALSIIFELQFAADQASSQHYAGIPTPVIRIQPILFVGRWNKHRNSGIELSNATVAGATGDIGSAVCRLRCPTDVAELLLIARNPERLQELQSALGRGKIMGLEEALPRQILWSGLLVCRRVEIDPALETTLSAN